MRRSGVGRVQVVAVALAGAVLLGAYSDQFTPVLRTTSPDGCDCGGTPGGGGNLTARKLTLRSTGDENWLLPLNQTVGIDLRGRNGVAPRIDSFLEDVEDGYHLKWAGDGSSILVAIEMPTTGTKEAWDLSDASGRISPTIADALAMASGDRSKKRGSFVKYSWRSVLFANDNALDHLGEFDPLTVKDGTGVTLCHRFDGGTFTPLPSSYGMYGDYFFFKPFADTFGYLRQYDVGACSAAANLVNFVQRGLDDAEREREQPVGDTYPGVGDTVVYRIDDLRLVLVPRLQDIPAGSPAVPGTSPFRTPTDEGVELRVEAKGKGTGTFLGSDIECNFSATYQASFAISASPQAVPYFNRVKLKVVDQKPDVKISGCSGNAGINFLLAFTNAIVGALTIGNASVDLDEIVSGFAKGGQLRGDIVSQFRQVESELNESLILPIPSLAALQIGPGAPLPRTFFEEWQQRLEASLPLHADATGPGGSCVASDLRHLDNSQCSPDSIAPVLARLQVLSPRLAEALTNIIQREPEALECRPIRGGATQANAAWIAPKLLPNGSEQTFARFISGCDASEAARLFEYQGEILQGCVQKLGKPHCLECFAKQDSGLHCDVKKLLASGCLAPNIERPPFIGNNTAPVPQVSCRRAPSAPSTTVCVPRFHPGSPPKGFTKASENNAMCVPMQQAAATYLACAPCLSFTSRVTPGALGADPGLQARVNACLDAPAHCRTVVGTVTNTTCDATNAADVLLSKGHEVRITTPMRCGLRLPFSRIDVEPDRLDLVMAEAFPCPNGTSPPCRVTNVAGADFKEAAAVFWSELLGLAQTFGVGLTAPGFDAPSCFPDRNEVLGGLNPESANDPLAPRGSGPMGFLGQAKRASTWLTVANSPICGWQNASSAAIPVAQ